MFLPARLSARLFCYVFVGVGVGVFFFLSTAGLLTRWRVPGRFVGITTWRRRALRMCSWVHPACRRIHRTCVTMRIYHDCAYHPRMHCVHTDSTAFIRTCFFFQDGGVISRHVWYYKLNNSSRCRSSSHLPTNMHTSSVSSSLMLAAQMAYACKGTHTHLIRTGMPKKTTAQIMNAMGDHSTASPESFKPFLDLDVDLKVRAPPPPPPHRKNTRLLEY